MAGNPDVVDQGLDVAAPRPRGPLRLVTVLIVLVMAVVAVGSMFVARNVVDDQEQRLLDQRAGEVGVLLSNAVEGVSTSLAALGSVADVTASDPAAFERRAAPLAGSGQFAGVLLVEQESGTVLAAAGEEFEAGDMLSGDRLATVRQAGLQLTTTDVIPVGGTRHLGLALGPPAAPAGQAVYAESVLDPEQQQAAASGEPFADLDIALYVGPETDPDQLLLATAGELGDDASRQTVTVGGEEWVMLVDAEGPLVGELATNMPWILLVAGLVVAALVGGLVELLGRRRDYALVLVEERTSALRQSLAELEEARDQLVRSERLAAIGELASAVGHELRNPLGVLTNGLYLLRTALDDPATMDRDRVRRRLATAERELAAATLIVSDLLEFARQREPVLGAVALPELVDEALSVAPAPEGVRVERRFDADLPTVAADRDQLRQVLLNLVVNAYDALSQGGDLTVAGEASGGQVHLVVSDTGAGMDEGVRSRVFEPFFTGKVKGIGLGLAVSRRIVEAHGGSIEVTSEPDAGSTFTVVLPVAVPAPAHSGRPA